MATATAEAQPHRESVDARQHTQRVVMVVVVVVVVVVAEIVVRAACRASSWGESTSGTSDSYL
jgi:hypothetical protein